MKLSLLVFSILLNINLAEAKVFVLETLQKEIKENKDGTFTIIEPKVKFASHDNYVYGIESYTKYWGQNYSVCVAFGFQKFLPGSEILIAPPGNFVDIKCNSEGCTVGGVTTPNEWFFGRPVIQEITCYNDEAKDNE